MTLSKILTIGVYGFDEELFFQELINNKVDLFCDLRRRRGVRGAQYAFVNSQKLQDRLATLGIDYRHILELAPSKETRAKQKQDDKSNSVLKRNRSELSEGFIQAYEEECLKNFNFREFVGFMDSVSVIALFCVEKEPMACHRSLVAQKLSADSGISIEHLKPWNSQK